MISLVEARHYRCLRYVRQKLGPFHVIVGPNASGKTTFLDAIAFLSQLVSDGLEAAVESRTANFSDLVWWHEPGGFEIAVEAKLPEVVRHRLDSSEWDWDTIRYEVRLCLDEDANEVQIRAEQGFLKNADTSEPKERPLFPMPECPPDTIISRPKPKQRRLFSKARGGNDNYNAEARQRVGRWRPAFKLGPRKSTLGNLPEDDVNFPASSWFKQFLISGVERIMLNSLEMRSPSPPGQGTGFRADGSNLPWVVADLRKSASNRLREWIAHVQTALPDLESVTTVIRPEDRHCYLNLVYRGGLEVPSWMASDGTLRLLALTLPAYLNGEFSGSYLIEEPENGIHPRAVEAMYDSLSHVYGAQILLATHSPVILSIAEPEDILCFAKTRDGATDIVSGENHPKLRDWRGEESLSTLFAAGVLG